MCFVSKFVHFDVRRRNTRSSSNKVSSLPQFASVLSFDTKNNNMHLARVA